MIKHIERIRKSELNHKGTPCLYKKNLTCQEGECKGCNIYLEWCKSLWG